MHECGRAEFGDERVTQRFIKVVSALAEHPGTSLVQAAESWGEAKGIYRFFNNARVFSDRILLSHRKATVERIRGQQIVLVAQDTTTLSFNTLRATRGLGPVGPADSRGFFLHSGLAMDVGGVPLGLLTARFWARDGEEPVEKESQRWVETVREVRGIVPEDTRVVVIGDRESDIFAVFTEAKRVGADVLVRATHNRKLEGEWPDLAEAMQQARLLGTMEVTVPRGHEHPERQATLALHAQEVQLRPPQDQRGTEPVTMTVVSASELDPPAGEKAVGWVLLTTLQAATAEQAAVVVRWYSYRWRIERFHYTLKSGCQIEKLQLETQRRLENAVATYCIVAWRVLHFAYVARDNPDAPCTLVFTEAEWKGLYLAIYRKAFAAGMDMPKEPPKLSTAVVWLGRLGGFLARKDDGMPGVKVLWRGFQRLEIFTAAWIAAHPRPKVGKG